MESAEEVFAGERFLEERAGFEWLGRAVKLFGIARHENDFELGEFFLGPASELLATHARHDDVGDEKMDGVFEAFGDFESFDAVRSGKDLVAGGLQKFTSESAHRVFVFNEENGFAIFECSGDGLGSRRHRRLLLREGQVDFKA